ncbi:MAG: hypothetical protein FJ123_18895 [Deltaproteobacteria bacterium]|nr:hypothetical protein [Deltaproteobacteria bacterium]
MSLVARRELYDRHSAFILLPEANEVRLVVMDYVVPPVFQLGKPCVATGKYFVKTLRELSLF